MPSKHISTSLAVLFILCMSIFVYNWLPTGVFLSFPLLLHRFEMIAMQMTSPPALVHVLSIGFPGAPTVEIVMINVYNMNFYPIKSRSDMCH